MLKACLLVCVFAGAIGAANIPGNYFLSGGKRVTVESFRPDTPNRLPAVVFLHGADGLSLNGSRYRESAQQLARHGFAVFLVHYFDRTATRWAGIDAITGNFLDWMSTVSDAITYAAAVPGVAPDRIGLVGTSLGASLALTVASQDARVGAVAEVSGLMPPPAVAFIRRMPPTLILHGTADPIVPVSEAYKLERLLGERGTDYEAKIYPGQGHVFSAAVARESIERTARFLGRTLKPIS